MAGKKTNCHGLFICHFIFVKKTKHQQKTQSSGRHFILPSNKFINSRIVAIEIVYVLKIFFLVLCDFNDPEKASNLSLIAIFSLNVSWFSQQKCYFDMTVHLKYCSEVGCKGLAEDPLPTYIHKRQNYDHKNRPCTDLGLRFSLNM